MASVTWDQWMDYLRIVRPKLWRRILHLENWRKRCKNHVRRWERRG